MKKSSNVEAIFQIASRAKETGISHLYTEDNAYCHNQITINEKLITNFGSCSYLGLEFDERLVNGGIRALSNYGTQFSASRSYMSCGIYYDLEKKFNKIFNAHCVIAPTTTLGHIATIPTIINREDAVILDHQVHSSVQSAVQLLKPKGVRVDMIRHNKMDLLEDRIKFLSSRANNIWYMADGIYSMFGDKAPVEDLYLLMDKYPQFHVYFDDAHGMSCYGENGQGYVLDGRKIHNQMIVATSLAKAFASGGAVFVFPNAEIADTVRKCGGPMITSGPMQPAALGVASACADIHLSAEITQLQGDLQENISYTNLLFKKLDLPLASYNDTSIFFLALGLPKVGYNLVRRVLNEGSYSNLGIFPAVPIKKTGLRFTITRLHTFEQIEKFAETVAYHYPKALREEGSSREAVNIAFDFKKEDNMKKELESAVNSSRLVVQHESTIHKIHKVEWNNIYENKGTFDWDGMALLQKSFSENKLPEHNWVFDYLVIKDSDTGKPILTTFFTTTLCKDDMLSGSDVSKEIESKRNTDDPYFLTSKTVTMGSFLTLGEHLWVDEKSSILPEAIEIMLKKINDIQARERASKVILRDFTHLEEKIEKIIIKNGFFKSEIPNNNIITNPKSGDLLLNELSSKSRAHLRKQVLKKESLYDIKIVAKGDDEQIAHWYELYLNVKKNKSEVNTFALPFKLFKQFAKSKQWEIIELRLKENQKSTTKKPIAVMFNHKSGDSYSPLLVGLDYSCGKFFPYQNALYASVKRSIELGVKNVYMGVTASFEKKKFGAKPVPMFSYVQLKDHYNVSMISALEGQKIKLNKIE